MRFGRTLRQSVYEPWKDQYIDYDKLKTLLREDAASKDADAEEPWTAEDETRFCEEIFNVQLVKVAGFQAEKFRSLKERIDAAFAQLRDMAPTAAAAHAAAASAGVVVAGPAAGETSEAGKQPAAVAADRLRSLEAELDAVTNEVRELKRYSNLNYTGFLKIAKKHDRRRGEAYRILPLTRLSLAREELNSERAYAPLLQKLGLMYFVIRHGLESKDGAAEPPRLLTDLESSSKTHNGEKYTAYKCELRCREGLVDASTRVPVEVARKYDEPC